MTTRANGTDSSVNASQTVGALWHSATVSLSQLSGFSGGGGNVHV